MSRRRPEADPRGWGSLPLAWGLHALSGLTRLLPLALLDLGAWWGATATAWVWRWRAPRELAERRGLAWNLRLAWGAELPPERARELTWRYALHLWRLAYELLRLPRLHAGRAREVVDFSEVDAVLRRAGPVIVATGHFGNWEAMVYAGSHEHRLVSLVRPVEPAGLQRWLKVHRAGSGHEAHSKFGGLRTLSQALRAGRRVGLVVDEDARRRGEFVPFCGLLASAHGSAAALQRQTGAPIAVVSCVRTGPERFRVRLWDLIELPEDAASLPSVEVTARVQRGLEQALLAAPEQWLWTRRRWHTRPPDEQADAEGSPPRVGLPLSLPSWEPLRLARGARVLGVALVGLFVLLGALALGPRRAADPARRHELRLPLAGLAGSGPGVVAAPASPSLAELASALAAREASVGDVRSNCAARIRFAGEPVQTELAVVYVHGFSATRQETAPLAEQLATSLGANLFEARLRGHGRPGPALGEARCEEWLADASEALAVGRLLGRRVVLVSCSTGSSLVAWLLAHGEAEGVLASIWISPNFAPRDPASQLLTGPWGAELARLLLGPERSWKPFNALQGIYWTTRYPSRVLVEMQAAVDLACAADLSQHRTPLLMIYSPRDQVLDPQAMEKHFARVGAEVKERWAFLEDGDPSHHVLAGAVLSPDSTAALQVRIEAFLSSLRGVER